VTARHRGASAARISGLPHERVDIGRVRATRSAMVLRTVLGSCASVCLFDPVLRIGGMNHILVPCSDCSGDSTRRCGVQAMELLINEMMKLGADRRRLVAKAFGCANVLRVFRKPTIGEANAAFVREFLRTEGIPLVAERMGGNKAVQLNFHTGSGKAYLRAVDGSRLPALVREEDAYFHTRTAERFIAPEPTLF
jgi:chemotaxis receptor (MCP) glutamine deamidase CheD